MRRRSGQAKEEVLKLTQQTGELLAKSVKGYVYNPAYYTGVIVHDLTPA